MKAVVINCSPGHYNLGAQKLYNWLLSQPDQYQQVAYYEGDPGLWALDAELVCLSVIFSWHAPLAREIALRMKPTAEVWCGGPGVFALSNWWRQETGLTATKGLDPRFERQSGDYQMVFASRGCPVNCSFCVVPRIEGTAFTLYWDFTPAPVLCDNNLSALPLEFQQHIVDCYIESGVTLVDANSGFEPSAFSEEIYHLWKPLINRAKGWRFAYDTIAETEAVQRTMQILKAERPERKRVYCLIGNEPVAACYERALKIIEWGGEPHCQFVLPLNWLGDERKLKPKYDWTVQAAHDFCRYFNRWLWRRFPLAEYKPRVNELPPFKHLLAA